MSIFRSEDMALYEISIPKDGAWDIMHELGQLDCIHFVDLNQEEQVFNLTFSGLLKRMEDTLRQLHTIEVEMNRNEIRLERPKDAGTFLQMMQEIAQSKEKHQSMLYEEVEKDVKEQEKFVLE